jgi:uncharacterized Tic20 family protein
MILIPIDWIFTLYGLGILLLTVSVSIFCSFWRKTSGSGELNYFTDLAVKRAINFQCSILLYLITILGFLSTIHASVLDRMDTSIVTIVSFLAFIILGLLLGLSLLGLIVGCVVNIFGQPYIYPLTIKFISEEI